MTHVRISVSLSQPELAALVQMAQTDCRHPREQLRYMLREVAKQRGLLRLGDQTDDEATDVQGVSTRSRERREDGNG